MAVSFKLKAKVFTMSYQTPHVYFHLTFVFPQNVIICQPITYISSGFISEILDQVLPTWVYNFFCIYRSWLLISCFALFNLSHCATHPTQSPTLPASLWREFHLPSQLSLAGEYIFLFHFTTRDYQPVIDFAGRWIFDKFVPSQTSSF